MTVQALFVDHAGIYPKLLGSDNCWRNKPTLSKREASATPEAFASVLVELARWSRK